MIRLSSNSTLFYKLVLPIFFAVLYGLLTIFLLVVDVVPFDGNEWVRYTNLAFYLAVLFILYKSVFQLLRVDCASDHFIVTNYRHAYRYTYDSVNTFKIENLLFFSVGIFEFKSPSNFGKHIIFLLDKRNLSKIQEKFDVGLFVD